jgi:hypothetical protein
MNKFLTQRRKGAELKNFLTPARGPATSTPAQIVLAAATVRRRLENRDSFTTTLQRPGDNRKEPVRRKIASRRRFADPCGQFHFPCADSPICADVFQSVRPFFNPCGRSPGSCGPTSRPCGDFPIRASVFRSVRAKSLVFHWFWRIIGGNRRESALIYVWEKRRKGRRKTRWREWWQSPDCAKYLGLRLERSAGFSPLQCPNWRGR